MDTTLTGDHDGGVTASPLAAAWSTPMAAEVYDRARPGYPSSSVEWVLSGAGRDARRVLDLGAGTGKLTGGLVSLGLDVVAVDRSSAMLEVLQDRHPSVETRVGVAEALPLPDASFDAVVCGQAWHWVDPGLAVPEAARVLRPGGVLGLLWNRRDETTPWVAALSEVMELPSRSEPPSLGEPFAKLERFVVGHVHRLRSADLDDLVHSRSYVLTMEAEDRQRLLDRVSELRRTHPGLAGRETVEVPYVTFAYRARTQDRRNRVA